MGLDFDIFLHHDLILIGGWTLLFIMIFGFAYNFRKARLELPLNEIRMLIRENNRNGEKHVKKRDLIEILGHVLFLDVATSKSLRTCERMKWIGHLLVFWGFVGAAIATTLGAVMNPNVDPLPLIHVVRLFGNVGGILLIIGGVMIFSGRFTESGSPWEFNWSDLFIVFLMGTTISGFAVQVTSEMLNVPATFVTYWAHIIFIILLFATAPFTKFMHAIYKPFWVFFLRIQEKYQRAEIDVLEHM